MKSVERSQLGHAFGPVFVLVEDRAPRTHWPSSPQWELLYPTSTEEYSGAGHTINCGDGFKLYTDLWGLLLDLNVWIWVFPVLFWSPCLVSSVSLLFLPCACLFLSWLFPPVSRSPVDSVCVFLFVRCRIVFVPVWCLSAFLFVILVNKPWFFLRPPAAFGSSTPLTITERPSTFPGTHSDTDRK